MNDSEGYILHIGQNGEGYFLWLIFSLEVNWVEIIFF